MKAYLNSQFFGVYCVLLIKMPTFLCSNAALYVDVNNKYKAERYFFTVKGSSENLTYAVDVNLLTWRLLTVIAGRT